MSFLFYKFFKIVYTSKLSKFEPILELIFEIYLFKQKIKF